MLGQLVSPLQKRIAQQGFTARIATLFDQVKEVRTGVVARIPLFPQIGQIRIELASTFDESVLWRLVVRGNQQRSQSGAR